MEVVGFRPPWGTKTYHFHFFFLDFTFSGAPPSSLRPISRSPPSHLRPSSRPSPFPPPPRLCPPPIIIWSARPCGRPCRRGPPVPDVWGAPLAAARAAGETACVPSRCPVIFAFLFAFVFLLPLSFSSRSVFVPPLCLAVLLQRLLYGAFPRAFGSIVARQWNSPPRRIPRASREALIVEIRGSEP